MKSLFVIQHTQAEYLGLIEDHFERRGVAFQYVRPFTAGGTVPGTAINADGLVLLGGGPWGTVGGKPLPTLQQEIRLARDFLARGRPVIGIGVGAQILCLAAGGGAEPAPLTLSVGEARRVADDGLNGFLPRRYPLIVYMRDRPVPPGDARILAEDGGGAAALFQIGDNSFGFVGHPGYKAGIVEDLIMENVDAAPDDCGVMLDKVRAVQDRTGDALAAIMTGLIQATGLMRDHDRRPAAIPILRG